MSFFINDALAAAPAHAQGDGTVSMLMIAAIFVLFYFMLIRPQNKRAKEHRALVSQLKSGDEIVTTGGLLGKVTTVSEQYLKVALTEGVEIHLQRNAVSSVLPKGTLKSI